MKSKKRISVVDIYFILLLAIFLVILLFLHMIDFLFKLPYVTLLAFYYVGKYARDLELRHYF